VVSSAAGVQKWQVGNITAWLKVKVFAVPEQERKPAYREHGEMICSACVKTSWIVAAIFGKTSAIFSHAGAKISVFSASTSWI
jgi:hypothetical protein